MNQEKLPQHESAKALWDQEAPSDHHQANRVTSRTSGDHHEQTAYQNALSRERSLRGDLLATKAELREHQRSVERHQFLLEQSQNQVSSLKKEMLSQQQQHKQLNTQLDHLKGRNTMLKAFSLITILGLGSASYIGYANMQDKEKLQADVTQLIQVGNDQKSIIESLNEANQGLDATLSETQSSLTDLQQQLKDTDVALTEMTQMRDQIQAKLSADLMAESSARADLETQAANLERQIQALQSEKSALLTSLEQTKHNVSVQFEELTNTKGTINQLTAKNRALEGEKNALNLKLAQQTETIEDLRQQEQTLLQDLEQAKQALDENSLEIQNQDIRIEALEQKIEQLQQQLNALNA